MVTKQVYLMYLSISNKIIEKIGMIYVDIAQRIW